MKSETRANWIFLALFMLVMGPGLIILTMKAYKKGAAGMNPPAPQTVSAYNNPNPQNPMLPRVVPPQTADFVASITARMIKLQPDLQPAGRDAASDGPRMSEKRSLEFLASGSTLTHHHIALLGWNKSFVPIPSLYEFVGIRGGQDLLAKIEGYQQENLPIDARSELQQYGYVRPPDGLIWILLEVPGPEPLDQLRLTYTVNGQRFEDVLDLAPISAATNPSK